MAVEVKAWRAIDGTLCLSEQDANRRDTITRSSNLRAAHHAFNNHFSNEQSTRTSLEESAHRLRDECSAMIRELEYIYGK